MSIRQNVKTYQKGQSLGQVDVATKCSGQAKTPLSHNSRKNRLMNIQKHTTQQTVKVLAFEICRINI